MGMLLKCIAVWFLLMWHEKNLWVLCNDNGPQSFSLPIENYYDPKPVSTDGFASFPPKNYTDKLQEKVDQLMWKGCFIFNGTVVTEQNISSEYLKSMEGGGGSVTIRLNTSCLDEVMILNKMSSDLLTSYRDSFPAIGHDNRPSSTKTQKGVIYEQNELKSSSLPSGKQNRPREYTESMEDGGGMRLHPDISRLDATLTASKELSDLIKSYHESFPVIGHDNRPSSTRARKGVIYEPNDPQGSSLPSGKQNRPHDYTKSMEDGSGKTLHPDISHVDATLTASTELSDLIKSYREGFPAIDQGNRPSSTKAQKRVVHELQIHPQEGVDSKVEGTSSSMERTYENTEKENNFPDKTCVCCLNNALKLGAINGSDDDCTKCCDTIQTGNITSDSVSGESDTAEGVNVSSADLVAQDSPMQNSYSSEKQDEHNSSSLDNTATSVTPLSRHKKPLFTRDATNGSSSLSEDLNKNGYAIQIVLVTLTVLVCIVVTVFFCKKHSKFCKNTLLRYCRCKLLEDILLDDVCVSYIHLDMRTNRVC